MWLLCHSLAQQCKPMAESSAELLWPRGRYHSSVNLWVNDTLSKQHKKHARLERLRTRKCTETKGGNKINARAAAHAVDHLADNKASLYYLKRHNIRSYLQRFFLLFSGLNRYKFVIKLQWCVKKKTNSATIPCLRARCCRKRRPKSSMEQLLNWLHKYQQNWVKYFLQPQQSAKECSSALICIQNMAAIRF